MITTLIKSHEEHLPAILKEIGTNVEQLKKDVKCFREWYDFQYHLPRNLNDSVLASFIVGSKNSIEVAKAKLDQYYSDRRRFSDYFLYSDPMSNDSITSYKTVYTFTLPKLTPDGSAVAFLKLRLFDPTLYNPTDSVKRLNMIHELMLNETILTSNTILVYDYSNCTPDHVLKITPVQAKTHLDTLKFLPIRFKGLIIINCPKYAETTYNILKKFMSDKIRNRVFIYSEGSSELKNHIPLDMLPKDYGGSATYTMDDLNDYWQEQLQEKGDWFINEREHQSDESKRPADNPYKPEGMGLGVDGSFKTLAID